MTIARRAYHFGESTTRHLHARTYWRFPSCGGTAAGHPQISQQSVRSTTYPLATPLQENIPAFCLVPRSGLSVPGMSITADCDRYPLLICRLHQARSKKGERYVEAEVYNEAHADRDHRNEQSGCEHLVVKGNSPSQQRSGEKKHCSSRENNFKSAVTVKPPAPAARHTEPSHVWTHVPCPHPVLRLQTAQQTPKHPTRMTKNMPHSTTELTTKQQKVAKKQTNVLRSMYVVRVFHSNNLPFPADRT